MTILEETLRVLSDLEWHCSICELPAAQAKTYQNIKDAGYSLDTTTNRGLYHLTFCEVCNRQTVHRRLKNRDPIHPSKNGSPLSTHQRSMIKTHYKNYDIAINSKRNAEALEIDHRFPKIRRSGQESSYKGVTDVYELVQTFQPLTRSSNQLKSRACEHCVETGERASPFGIKYWYEGGPYWEFDFGDERGCIGCFWYDPDQWRDSLNCQFGV